MRPLIVGPAPGRGNGEPLAGQAGRRLAALCGLDLPAYLALFERVNLLPAFPGTGAGGDLFPIEDARAAAIAMREKVAARDPVILLGWNVARAFGIAGAPIGWFEATRFSRDTGEVFVAPHPSGRSRWWNDRANVHQARMFWSRIARECVFFDR